MSVIDGLNKICYQRMSHYRTIIKPIAMAKLKELQLTQYFSSISFHLILTKLWEIRLRYIIFKCPFYNLNTETEIK